MDMITVLLIDDEDMELEGLETMINGMDLDCTVCGKARNAFQGIELAQKYRPDVILSDIKMPKMEGTEMAAKIQELGIQSFLVFISGHQDFSAAQQAIQLGARSFLLKPVNRDSLRTLLLQAGEELQKGERETMQKQVIGERLEHLSHLDKQTFARRLMLNDTMTKEEILSESKRLDLPMEGRQLAIVLLYMYIHDEEDKYWECSSAALWDSLVTKYNAFPPVILTNGDICFLFSFSDILSKEEVNNHLIAAGEQIVRIAIGNIYSRINVGISEISEDITQIYTLVRQARAIVRQEFYSGYGKVFLYERRPAAVNSIITQSPENIKDILYAIAEGDCGSYDKRLRRLLSPYDVMTKKEVIRGICIDIISQAQRLCLELGIKEPGDETGSSRPYIDFLSCRTLDETLDYMMAFGGSLCAAVLEKRQDQIAQLIGQIEQIIGTEYQSSLSIDEIASRVYLSASYISRVYKNYTGKTILDRLQSVRMKKALEFLQQPQYRIYEIGSLVGYESPSYFSMVFKKCYGMTPGKYRERMNIYEGS